MLARRHAGRKRLYPEARTCVISANAAAKRHGVGTGTGVNEARRRCPGIALVSQRPDLYVRVQRRITCAVNAEIPIDAVCSVDELCCVLEARDGAEDMGRRLRRESWTEKRVSLAVERLGAPPWQGAVPLDRVNDDRMCLAALGRLWAALVADGVGGGLYRVQVSFDRLAAVNGRQGARAPVRAGRGHRR